MAKTGKFAIAAVLLGATILATPSFAQVTQRAVGGGGAPAAAPSGGGGGGGGGGGVTGGGRMSAGPSAGSAVSRGAVIGGSAAPSGRSFSQNSGTWNGTGRHHHHHRGGVGFTVGAGYYGWGYPYDTYAYDDYYDGYAPYAVTPDETCRILRVKRHGHWVRRRICD